MLIVPFAIACATIGSVLVLVVLFMLIRPQRFRQFPREPSSSKSLVPAILAVATMFFLIAAGLAVADEAFAAAVSGAPIAEVQFVNVGEGDSVVIRVGKTVVLSDAGERDIGNVADALHDVGAHAIDIAILGHPNKDHVGNFPALLKDWKVKTAILSDSAYWHVTASNKRVLDALETHRVRKIPVTAGETFQWGGARWEILNPPAGSYTGTAKSESNNASIAYALRVNGVTLLFTGDIYRKPALEVAQRWTEKHLGHAAIFLVTHHGSERSSSPELLAAIHPTWAVLSVGPNKHEFPRPEAVQRLKASGSSIWCTHLNGTVVATISTHGRITWHAGGQADPFWSAGTLRQIGTCVRSTD
jgi:competence protein ComEC